MATGITFETTDCAETHVVHVRTGKRFWWVPGQSIRENGQSPRDAQPCKTKRDVVSIVIARCAVYR